MTDAQYPVAALSTDARASFLVRTYAHLLGAILLFIGIEYALFTSGLAYPIANAMLGTSWLLVLGGFMVVSWFASKTAAQAESKPAQYAALLATVAAQALIFVPLLALAAGVAQQNGDPNLISKAGWVTMIGFTALTALVVFTGKDFSFLGSLLKWGGIMALVAIVGAVVFGFELGTWFSVAMIGFAGAAILYDTDKVMNRYPEDRHVSASIELFASVALMFWYVLRLFMSRR